MRKILDMPKFATPTIPLNNTRLFSGPKDGLQPGVTAFDVLVFLLLRISSPLGLDFDGGLLHPLESPSLPPSSDRLLQDDDFPRQLPISFLLQEQIVSVF